MTCKKRPWMAQSQEVIETRKSSLKAYSAQATNKWLSIIFCLSLFSITSAAFGNLPVPPEPTSAQRLSGSTYVVVGKATKEKTIDVQFLKTGEISKVRVLEVAVDRFVFPQECKISTTFFIDLTLVILPSDSKRFLEESLQAMFFLREPYFKPPSHPKLYDFGSVYKVLFPLSVGRESEVKKAIPGEIERLKRNGYTRKCPEEIS